MSSFEAMQMFSLYFLYCISASLAWVLRSCFSHLSVAKTWKKRQHLAITDIAQTGMDVLDGKLQSPLLISSLQLEANHSCVHSAGHILCSFARSSEEAQLRSGGGCENHIAGAWKNTWRCFTSLAQNHVNSKIMATVDRSSF